MVGDATVLVLAVAPRHEGFAQTSAGVVLVRRGASNVPLLGDELSRFLSRRTFQRFEVTPTSAVLDDADPARLRDLGQAFGWPADHALPDRLEEEGFAVGDGPRRALTVAGALFLLADPAAVGGRPYVDVRRYPPDSPDPDKTWQVRGPADRQVEDATRAILDELGSVSAIVGARRVDMPKVPPRVIREVIANAVAHRSYEHAGSAIRVDLRPTHLTVTSPGGLPEPVTIDNLRYQQAARNDRVLGTLRRLHLAEDLGQGIDRMQDDMAAELLDPPEFVDDGSFFSVTLRLGGAVTPRERAWVRGLVQKGQLDGRAGILVVEVSVESGEVPAMSFPTRSAHDRGTDRMARRHAGDRAAAPGGREGLQPRGPRRSAACPPRDARYATVHHGIRRAPTPRYRPDRDLPRAASHRGAAPPAG
jgi:ATP-dependent DNA helicase RecG